MPPLQSSSSFHLPSTWSRLLSGRFRSVVALSAIALAVLAGMAVPAEAQPDSSSVAVIANRGSGTVSVVNSGDASVSTVDLPGDAEPMYVSYDERNDLVFVGDRASDSIVALDAETLEVAGSVSVGAGVFHQWLDSSRGMLWVVGTAASTVTVVETDSLTAVDTFAIPADLIERGGVTHDVFVEGNNAFVSVLGLDDGSGEVLQYSTRTHQLTNRITVGGDPHLYIRNGRLYVASQDASQVSVYVAATLRLISQANVPAAHGIFVTSSNDVFVTNIAGGGQDALWQLQGPKLNQIAAPVDTAVAVPHNVAVASGGTVFITHSGATASQVTIIDGQSGEQTVVETGTNPFGLAVIER